MPTVVRYVAIRFGSVQWNVVQPSPPGVAADSTPFEITLQPSGTRASSLNVALSFGVSFAGYQALAEWGSPAANAPPDDDSCHPFSPRLPSSADSGTPEYFTRVSNDAPDATGSAGVITSSCSPDRLT